MKVVLGWPKTLASQLSLLFTAVVILVQLITFIALYYERYDSTKATMLSNLESDISTAIAILNHLPANDRKQWLSTLQRRNYSYHLESDTQRVPVKISELNSAELALYDAIHGKYDVHFTKAKNNSGSFQAEVRLDDGALVVIDIHASVKPLSSWLIIAFLLQLILATLFARVAVKAVLHPFSSLVRAVENLDPKGPPVYLDETGPREIVNAASAFNSMQKRIAGYLAERMQLLAAISHDLQTPITRMKLRVEFLEDPAIKSKMNGDLNEMEHLVREGVVYAKSMHGAAEKILAIDLDSLLESIVFDYQDTGHNVVLAGKSKAILETRPYSIRRILVNLIDNAIKYAGKAEIEITDSAHKGILISVLDRGPGVDEKILEEITKPFFRAENSRNRNTGGAGLGLAIAQQLSIAIGGSLEFKNRNGGGFCATLYLSSPSKL